MGWFSFLILGIIAGVIAKLILRQKAGWFLTIILGVLGAMVGGWIAGLIPGIGYENFWSIQSWLIAIAGALLVLLAAPAARAQTAEIEPAPQAKLGAARYVLKLEDPAGG
mgnify:CR=1 FL=1